MRSGMLGCLERSRMLSAAAAVLMSTSAAGTRPRPSLRGTRRSETIAWSAVDKRCRISSCWCGGKNEITRLTVCVASVVCSVENTMCPVSAALSAVSSVSMSRISPIRMRSGSCRSTCRSAELNVSVSLPTSRCEMLACWSRCRNSIGSSIVMMLTRRFVLTWLIMAASAVDFPEPVTPVTSTRPRGICVIACLKLNAGRLLCVASPMRIHPEKDLAEFHRLRTPCGHFLDHPRHLGLDLVHDLHRFDNADDLSHVHPTPDFHIGLGAGLRRLIKRPDHRRLDLEILRPCGGWRFPSSHSP